MRDPVFEAMQVSAAVALRLRVAEHACGRLRRSQVAQRVPDFERILNRRPR
jgi:hypothetical protein